MFDAITLDLFKVIVLSNGQKIMEPQLGNVSLGYVTNFAPTSQQKNALVQAFKPLPITTLFSVEERKQADISSLIAVQLLHYIEVYGLGCPGLFNLEVTKGKVLVIANVRGVTVEELGELVRTMIYANAPVRNLEGIVELIQHYRIPYDLSLVQNNEARIRLYRDGDRFTSGDDAVRYIVFKTTADSLLIKSPEVLAGVKTNAKSISLAFLSVHADVLAQVFNRHKRIIMSLKDRRTATAINRISRLSKTRHVPIITAINKVFMAKALGGEITDYDAALAAVTLRDKFKYLNLLAWRRLQQTDDVFIIRNGRSHLEPGRKVYDIARIDEVSAIVLASAKADLAHLKGRTILLDANVDYGLPSSQKQMLGNLPFGTVVSVGDDTISSGIYWEDRWGARDLDLSAIDETGGRTGWGQYSGYDRDNPILFSGDITSAPNGAMEFLTSKTGYALSYGLFVNIFSGEEGAECELVIGSQVSIRAERSQKWIDNPLVREKVKLNSRGSILGFVRDGRFTVFAPRVSNSRVSGSPLLQKLVAKGLASTWTVGKLLKTAGIEFDTTPVEGKVYDFDLSYSSISIDKIEGMLFNRS